MSGLAQRGVLGEERRKEKQPSPGVSGTTNQRTSAADWISPFSATGTQSQCIGERPRCPYRVWSEWLPGPESREGRPTHSRESWEARCAGARNAGLPIPFWVWFQQDPAEQLVPKATQRFVPRAPTPPAHSPSFPTHL